MDASKKKADDFVREIIIPIEQSNIDSGNLFVLIKPYTINWVLFGQNSFGDDERGENDHDWPFPTEDTPGEWIEEDKI